MKLPPASPKCEQDKTGQAQNFKAMMQDMMKSYLTEFGVIPKADTKQSQSTVIVYRVLSDSEQEGPVSGTTELDQLMITTEEQIDFASFALASSTVTRAPLWVLLMRIIGVLRL